MDRHRIGIVIPALNEARTIRSLVANACRYGLPIVVDDGSCDETGELATFAGAIVVRHERNLGYDRALSSGFERASEINCAYVVTMDADGQHDPTILKSFISALDDGADLVIGVRDRMQRLGEHIFSWVAYLKWGIRDPLCGMKGYRIGLYQERGHFDSYDSIGTELTIYAARMRRHIVQIPIKTSERTDIPRFGRCFSANKRIFHALRYAFTESPNAMRGRTQ